MAEEGDELHAKVDLDPAGFQKGAATVAQSAHEMGKGFTEAAIPMAKLTSAFALGELAADALKESFTELKELMKEGIQLAEAQEMAEIGLANAFKARGIFTEQALQASKDLAREMEKLTGINERQFLASERMLVSLTGMTASALPKAEKGIADLARLLQVDMVTATTMAAHAIDGHSRALNMQGFTLNDNLTKQERFDQLLKQIKERADGMASQGLPQYTRAVQELTNAWDKLLIAFGEYIEKSPEIIAFIKTLALKVEDLAASLADGHSAASMLAEAITSLVLVLSLFADAIRNYLVDQMRQFNTVMHALQVILEDTWKVAQVLFPTLISGVDMLVTKIDALGNKFAWMAGILKVQSGPIGWAGYLMGAFAEQTDHAEKKTKSFADTYLEELAKIKKEMAKPIKLPTITVTGQPEGDFAPGAGGEEQRMSLLQQILSAKDLATFAERLNQVKGQWFKLVKDDMTAGMAGAKHGIQELANTIKNTLGGAVQGTAKLFSQFFSDLVTDSGSAGDKLIAGMIGMIGQMMETWGSFFILVGTGMLVVPGLQIHGGAAIAAGVALLAAGGVLQGVASMMSNRNSPTSALSTGDSGSGGGGPVASGAPATDATASSLAPRQPQTQVTVNIMGADLLPRDQWERIARENLAPAFRRMIEDNGVVILKGLQ